MKGNVISKKYGWYLARINASLENFENIVVTSLANITKYNLNPGRYIKICSLIQAHSTRSFLDRLILIPYFKDCIDNYRLLQDVLKSLTSETYRNVDKEYINAIIKSMSMFNQDQDDNKGFKIKELFDFELQATHQMDIAMPECWLNENSVDLGETVLLRNDEPSPVIL